MSKESSIQISIGLDAKETGHRTITAAQTRSGRGCMCDTSNLLFIDTTSVSLTHTGNVCYSE